MIVNVGSEPVAELEAESAGFDFERTFHAEFPRIARVIARVVQDPGRAEEFYAAVRRYYPGLADGAIQPGYAGIRPKLQGSGAPAADFVIQGPEEHGVGGLTNLYGIESPGLTSSLAIADAVANKLGIAS